MITLLDAQTKLAAVGFDPGHLDGIMGPDTRRALIAFQRSRGLSRTGLADASTLAALFGAKAKPTILPPWYEIALRKKGLHEGRDNAALRMWLKSDGKTLGDPARNPWCGDFVETCIKLALPTERVPSNPYLARNWLQFGVECEPTLGAIGVLWRGKRQGTAGHVFFVSGMGKGVIYGTGGNQTNAINTAPFDVTRLLGCVWPKTYPVGPVVLPTMHGGKLSLNEA